MSFESAAHSRKHLDPGEHHRFLCMAAFEPPPTYTLCAVLTYTGCKLSEALALCADDIDLEKSAVNFTGTRRRGNRNKAKTGAQASTARTVPVPEALLDILQSSLQLEQLQRSPDTATERLWPVSRMTGWRWVVTVMHKAGIRGAPASPKGLRHSFAARALQAGVPMYQLQYWLGRVDMMHMYFRPGALSPTEQQRLTKKMWGNTLKAAKRA